MNKFKEEHKSQEINGYGIKSLISKILYYFMHFEGLRHELLWKPTTMSNIYNRSSTQYLAMVKYFSSVNYPIFHLILIVILYN
jgi:hypothetical protein